MHSNSDSASQPHEMTETDIMQMLDKKKMSVVEKCFQDKEKGLAVEEFLAVMLQHLDFDKNDKQFKMKVTLALIQLFKQIDVNGDGTMQWQQFSNHIIELGLLRNDRSFKNLIKSYFLSDTLVDKQKHENSIENVYYFEQLKYLFSVEKDSSRFKVYNANNANLLYEVNAHKGSILAVQHLVQQNLIATSSNDLTINFWDSGSFTLKQILSVPEIQLCVRYANWKSSHTQLLYTGGSDSIVHIYDASDLKEKGTISGWNPFYRNDSQQVGHNGPIGDILPIDIQQTLVTGGYDGNICLWDSVTHQPKKQLKGHQKGVYSLDWCDWSQMNQCLLSAGLDHEAYVWNTYVKQKIFLLRGHNHPLVGVKCLPDTPQIITADIAGMVKIWDVRNFLCMQTFNVQAEQVNAFCLTYSATTGQSMKKRIVCASKKMFFYEYDQPKDQFLTDQKICLKVLFNETLLVFITLHADCLKIWSAKDGKLESVYRGLSSGELTVAILDTRQRKLFVGDSQGDIFTVNIKNGARMKSFQRHDSLITGLCYWTSQSGQDDTQSKDARRLISISKGPEVFIHDQDSPEDAQSSCRYTMKQHKDSCNSIVIKEGSEILTSASDDGNIILTNLISYRQEILPRCSQHQIKKLVFLGEHNCLVACDSEGKVIFYMVGESSRFRNKILFSMDYQTLSLTKKMEVFPVMAIGFDPHNKLLILGDEFGNIEGWDLSQLLKLVDECRVEQKRKKKRREIDKDLKQEMGNTTSSGFITSLLDKNQQSQVSPSDFSPKLIKTVFQIKKAHSDGITHIEVIGQYHSFATSSFDCCCTIWSLKNYRKIGSLIIGGDRNWGLQFNLAERKKNAVNEANKLLGKINKVEVDIDSDEDEPKKAQRIRRELTIRKQQCTTNAKILIDRHRKLNQTINDRPQRFVDPIEQAQKMQQGMFSLDNEDSDDESHDYHLLEDVYELKRKNLGAMVMKGNNVGLGKKTRNKLK